MNGTMKGEEEKGEGDEETERVVYSGKGEVLGKGTILKLDQYEPFPHILTHKLLSGAPNFRKASSSNIYGVGQVSSFTLLTLRSPKMQPTLFGIRTVLNTI